MDQRKSAGIRQNGLIDRSARAPADSAPDQPGTDGTPERRSSAGADTLVAAAVDAFVEHGYHGTSVRDIAARANMTVAALYYHFPAKHDVLDLLMTDLMEDVCADLRVALASSPADPAVQLVALVRSHSYYHTSRQKETFIANTELRSLEGEARARVIRLRDDVESIFRAVVQAGVNDGSFTSTMHPNEITRAIIAMSMHISQWYHEGLLTADDVADRYAHIALDMVRYSGNATDVVRSMTGKRPALRAPRRGKKQLS